MKAGVSTIAAYSLAAYIGSTELVAASSRIEPVREVDPESASAGTYVGASNWDFLALAFTSDSTSVASDQRLVRPGFLVEGRDVAGEIIALGALKDGWDGERASAPSVDAINDAVKFARLVQGASVQIEPTVHADGSILLELEDGSAGSLRFLGDGTIAFAHWHIGYGVVPFNGVFVPSAIAPIFCV